MNNDDVVNALGNLTVLEVIALTKELEAKWGVEAKPAPVVFTQQNTKLVEAQTEFTVTLVSVPADKKMAVVKAVRELTQLGLKESKDLVEAAPKMLKELVSAAEAEDLKVKLTAAGAVIEVK